MFSIKRVILIVLSSFLMPSCLELGLGDLGDANIFVNNKSDMEIACYVADGLYSGFSYPDTGLDLAPNTYCLKEHIITRSIIWGARTGNYARLVSWTQNGVLSVYIFDQEKITGFGIDYVFLVSDYLVRYDLTSDDLEDLKGEVYYPPTPNMKDIKMIPPYESFCQE